MRLKRIEVDFNHLIEVLRRVRVDFSVAGEFGTQAVGQVGNFGATRGTQVAFHAVVVAKRRSGSAHLGAHVADRSFTRTAEGFRTVAEVLDDGSGSAFHGQDSGNLEDHILG